MNNFFHTQQQRGFTLIETIVAIFILTMTIGALLTLTAGGFYSVRYARNQIVADYLAQESLEFIRNSRDTQIIEGYTWDDWKTLLNVDEFGSKISNGSYDTGCYSKEGCIVDPYTIDAKIVKCVSECDPLIFYGNSGFYGYKKKYPDVIDTGTEAQTTFVRKVTASEADSSKDQIIITVSISWLNGTNPKTVSQSTLITNWQ
jgi:prepilin-type N-terminal cleavage/methylation domain-containing protein